jgi:hypothetical protein
MEFKYFTGYRNCMKTKTLDINGKVLLGVFSVVLVITSIIVMPLVLSAPPAGKGRKYKVTVHVQDSGGNPVRGAKVTIYDELENPVTDTKTTNKKGNAGFSLPDGSYKAEVVVATGPIWQGFTVSGAPVEVLVTV